MRAIFLLLFYSSLASLTLCITISRHLLILCALSLLYAGIIFNTRIGRGTACCYDGGLLPFATLLLLSCYSLATLSPPFVTLRSHFYAGIIFNTRIGRGIAYCYVGGFLPFATLLLLSCYSFASLLFLFAPTFMRVLFLIPASGEALLVVMMAGYSLLRLFCYSLATPFRFPFAPLLLLFAPTFMRVLFLIPAHERGIACCYDGELPPFATLLLLSCYSFASLLSFFAPTFMRVLFLVPAHEKGGASVWVIWLWLLPGSFA